MKRLLFILALVASVSCFAQSTSQPFNRGGGSTSYTQPAIGTGGGDIHSASNNTFSATNTFTGHVDLSGASVEGIASAEFIPSYFITPGGPQSTMPAYYGPVVTGTGWSWAADANQSLFGFNGYFLNGTEAGTNSFVSLVPLEEGMSRIRMLWQRALDRAFINVFVGNTIVLTNFDCYGASAYNMTNDFYYTAPSNGLYSIHVAGTGARNASSSGWNKLISGFVVYGPEYTEPTPK